MTIYIASDHRGVEVKKKIIKHLLNNGIETKEIGLKNNESDNYPDFAFKLGRLVTETKDSLGILICGNGVGMSIAANKVKGIRCVKANSIDDAFKGKQHNGCNVIAVGVEQDINLINEIIDTFISTKPTNTERHLNRIDKIIKYENGEYNEL